MSEQERKELRYSYSGRYRLKTKFDFEAFRPGSPARPRRFQSRHFLVLALARGLPQSRLGIAVTTKVDKRAARRNLLKRRIREIFRHNRGNFRGAMDLLVIARNEATACSYQEVEREMLTLFARASLLKG